MFLGRVVNQKMDVVLFIIALYSLRLDQGQQAHDRKAFVVNMRLHRSYGCAGKDRVFTMGNLVLRVKGRGRMP